MLSKRLSDGADVNSTATGADIAEIDIPEQVASGFIITLSGPPPGERPVDDSQTA